MQSFTQSTLEQLSQVSGSPCVSIYFPTHRKGSETQQDPIRLKNALKEAGSALEAEGWDERQADRYLESARELIEQFEFWQHQEAGLALFIAEGFFQMQQLPYEVEELTIVSDRFHTAPLMPLLTDNGAFYLLAASQNAVRFFEADRYSIQELSLGDDTPLSLAEALKYDEADPQLQMHQGSGDSVAYHGQGTDEDNENSEIRRYFHKLDKGVMALIADQNKPLLFAGVDFLFPIYKDANSYSHLVEQHLTGNPDNMSAEELHCNAWAAISERFEQAKRESVDEYYAAANSDKASDQIKQLIPAAFNGQIDKLFMVEGHHVWGQFDAEANELTIHDEREAGDRDLIELAAIKAIANHGEVIMMEAKTMPNQAELAATLRYPLEATVPAGIS